MAHFASPLQSGGIVATSGVVSASQAPRATALASSVQLLSFRANVAVVKGFRVSCRPWSSVSVPGRGQQQQPAAAVRAVLANDVPVARDGTHEVVLIP